MTVAIVIVSFNTRETTLECLRKVYTDGSNASLEVWVVDNSSTDGSVSAIRDSFPSVNLVSNAINRGFGAANNQAIGSGVGDAILLLNSDAFLSMGAISKMAMALQSHPDVGVVGPRLIRGSEDLQQSCARFPSPLRAWLDALGIQAMLRRLKIVDDYRSWPHDQERFVESVVGACMLVRREAFEQVGAFDEAFFLYWEETELQHRLQDAGWKVLFSPATCVTHLGGASATSGDAAKFHNTHFFNSLDYYFLKRYGRVGLVSYRASVVVGHLLRLGFCVAMWLAGGQRRESARQKMSHSKWLISRHLSQLPTSSSTRKRTLRVVVEGQPG